MMRSSRKGLGLRDKLMVRVQSSGKHVPHRASSGGQNSSHRCEWTFYGPQDQDVRRGLPPYKVWVMSNPVEEHLKRADMDTNVRMLNAAFKDSRVYIIPDLRWESMNSIVCRRGRGRRARCLQIAAVLPRVGSAVVVRTAWSVKKGMQGRRWAVGSKRGAGEHRKRRRMHYQESMEQRMLGFTKVKRIVRVRNSPRMLRRCLRLSTSLATARTRRPISCSCYGTRGALVTMARSPP